MSTILPSWVDVTGSGSAGAAPDMVNLDLRVARDGANVSETLAAVDEAVTSVRSALTDAGIAERDVATTSTGIHQRYDTQGQPTPGFSGSHTLRVGVRDLDAVSPLVDAVVAAAGGTLLIDGITLAIADPAPLLATARERAFEDARSRAQEYARFAGRSLGEILWIGDTVTAPEPRPYAMRAEAAMAGGLHVAPGESTVTAQLSVRWAWGDT
jgi:uncharacterized protein